ncbi:hypothetical protein VTN77DRAFT_4176 [Rasamsonia byssochlamydoides]|uniref:uncharacterized protein n=1 Tax=Rasamsonia byssochlamydoides TaxID=89139 RepID=UPI0037440AE0
MMKNSSVVHRGLTFSEAAADPGGCLATPGLALARSRLATAKPHPLQTSLLPGKHVLCTTHGSHPAALLVDTQQSSILSSRMVVMSMIVSGGSPVSPLGNSADARRPRLLKRQARVYEIRRVDDPGHGDHHHLVDLDAEPQGVLVMGFMGNIARLRRTGTRWGTGSTARGAGRGSSYTAWWAPRQKASPREPVRAGDGRLDRDLTGSARASASTALATTASSRPRCANGPVTTHLTTGLRTAAMAASVP